ncbi:probable thiopurine S-methyltransferase isoform X1 [Octopus bimaculoides]|uniref:probable thiopurine S-methyltransferase isoform X1 n=1 Tax=Octopus bimaculoides TaxID=37653 RepID=UPI00071CE4BF|nr:probable thiopurine S-methyltransferase isoform X1 [Octopus bimaculoides]XP_014778198.1 probable thiopurine S-methyltransferase isoform X1 [Octopus bimaculoides]XP_052824208.1 probable thiopurine S-methyltransferase isoform X1 [Octopus bimaculoides]|eukprot:XP_014778197.1 PREDICTED: probable thiopurine S-methyltransferase [Octopus bimaculoides]
MTESEKKATSDAEFNVNDYWINRWNTGKIRFHREEMHISLEKHLDKFIDGRNGIKIFFPLCGKCVDMKGLADKGHNVVGVDIAEQAFQEFFTDQNLEYTVEELKDNTGKLFTSKDGKIKLYCMDIFKFSKDFEGQFNAIWDRGAFAAIIPKTRERYAQVIKGLLSPDCHYMIATMQYDLSLFPGKSRMVEQDTL